MALRRYQITDAESDILAGIDADGGVIVEGFLSEDLVERVSAELLPHVEGFETGSTSEGLKKVFWGDQTKRFTGLAARSPAFAEVIDHPLFHAWAEQRLVGDYWMNTGQAMVVGPGSEAQMLHRDAGNWPVMLNQGKDGPEATLSMMLAFSDFTLENGATRVVPGSHVWDDYDREAQATEVVQAVMPRGSALLYTGKTIHGAGANVSDDQWRFGIHLSVVLAQLTPEEAHTVMVPWDIAQNYSERVQHMLGYRSHRIFLPDWPVLWTADYRELREHLSPPPEGAYESAAQKQFNARQE